MTDIAERLRTEEPSYVLLGDAAIEIERLRNAAVERMDSMTDVLERWTKSIDKMLGGAWEAERISGEMAAEIKRLREENKNLREECRSLENSINRMLND